MKKYLFVIVFILISYVISSLFMTWFSRYDLEWANEQILEQEEEKIIHFNQSAKLTGYLSELEVPLANRMQQNRRLKEQAQSEMYSRADPIIIERTVFVLSLTQPIDVLVLKKNKYYADELNVTKVQLTTYSHDLMKEIESFRNKKVAISCLDIGHKSLASLKYSATEVVCNVGKIIEIYPSK